MCVLCGNLDHNFLMSKMENLQYSVIVLDMTWCSYIFSLASRGLNLAQTI